LGAWPATAALCRHGAHRGRHAQRTPCTVILVEQETRHLRRWVFSD
jgi:hypothetical protein